MILCDVNVLVYAHREDAVDHVRNRQFVTSLLNGHVPFAVSDLVLSGFLRVVTHPKIFSPPSPAAKARAYATQIRNHPNAVPIVPGPNHWGMFLSLCRKSGATGNAIPDAYYAALAMEADCEWITTDHGFARFPGLRWRHPLS